MTTKHKHDNPILVTGAAGAVGGTNAILNTGTLEATSGGALILDSRNLATRNVFLTIRCHLY
jgi:hypothetical protein